MLIALYLPLICNTVVNHNTDSKTSASQKVVHR